MRGREGMREGDWENLGGELYYTLGVSMVLTGGGGLLLCFKSINWVG